MQEHTNQSLAFEGEAPRTAYTEKRTPAQVEFLRLILRAHQSKEGNARAPFGYGALLDACLFGLAMLRDSGEAIPSVSEAREAFAAIHRKDAAKKYAKAIRLRSAPKSETGAALYRAIDWNDGSGSLYCAHPWAMSEKGSLADRMDTMAQVYLTVTKGNASRAADAWARALGRERR